MNIQNNLPYVLVAIYLTINLLAFVLMLIDKNKSRRNNSKRISEAMMFFLSIFFGAIGVYAGMFAFHHKTRKIIFIVGIPLAMIQNVSFLYVLYKFFQSF